MPAWWMLRYRRWQETVGARPGESRGHAEMRADRMNRLPFVRWDRFVADDDEDDMEVYGWIDRTDGRSDFVILHWEGLGYDMSATDPPGFTTSSAEFSAEISQLLYGATSDDHIPCQRVDEHFGDLVHSKAVLA